MKPIHAYSTSNQDALMSLAASMLVAGSSRPVQLRMRSDLRAVRQTFQGRECWAVHDPLRSRYFRFEREEFALLEMFDGAASLDSIRHRFETRFAPQRITSAELQRFASRAYEERLLIADSPGQGERLLHRAAEERRGRWLAALSNPLAIRIPLFNPEWLLRWIEPAFGWMFAPRAAATFLMLVVVAALMLAARFDEVVSRLPAFRSFFAVDNWIWLAAALAGSKLWHELGHAVACRRFGGRCREMGILLLVFTPCLYCDVSDAWMISDKRRRMAIAAAGMYFELLLAAASVIVWWFTAPGLLHALSLNVVVVCSIGSLAFNANPLLRYDGYYLLSDAVEIPNLRRRADEMLRGKFAEWWLGSTPRRDPFAPQRGQSWLALYAAAAWTYRWMMVFAIGWFLNRVFEPYGLQSLGRALVAMVVVGMIAGPLVRLAKRLRSPLPMKPSIRWPRAVWTTTLALIAAAALLTVPLPRRIVCPVQVEPRGAASVYVDVPGTVAAIHVRPGDRVATGTPIMTLDNIELHRVVSELNEQRNRMVARLAGLRKLQKPDDAELLEADSLERAIATLQDEIALRRSDLDRLVILAPAAGVVVHVRDEEMKRAASSLLGYGGELAVSSPLDDRRLGSRLERGAPICRIADSRRCEARLTIDEADMPFVRTGQTVEVFLNESATIRCRTKIEHVSSHQPGVASRIQEVLNAAATTTDAFHPVRNDSSADQSGSNTQLGGNRPVLPGSSPLPAASYEATCPLDVAHFAKVSRTDASPTLGSEGTAKIHAAPESLARRFLRSLHRTIRFDL